MKTILVPTDFSPNSEAAFQLAMVIARQEEASLLILHVFNVLPGAGANTPMQVDERLRHYCAKLDHKGDIPYAYRAVEGEVVPAIIKVANEPDTGLIVMGTHGERNVVDHVFGTIATRVLEKAPCPVIAVPPGTNVNKGITKVAYATDYRQSDLPAIKTVVSLASHLGAEVVLLHVIPEEHEPEKEVNNLYGLLKKAEEETGYPRLSCELLCGEDVEEKLIEYTVSAKVQMLVMSSQHRGWFERLFRPSLSVDMAESGKVPVIVFHHRREPVPKVFA